MRVLVFAGSPAVSSFGGSIEAFDATGASHCSGTPKVCTPLWSAPVGADSLVVANGMLDAMDGGTLRAFSS